MEYTYRSANFNQDGPQLLELWHQAGWREEHFNMEMELKYYIPACDSLLAERNGRIVGAVGTMPGSYRHLNSEITLCGVTSVITAVEARRQAVGSDLTRKMLQQALEAGAEVALLGAFDLGYYNRLGFGNGLAHQMIIIDPADIALEGTAPILHKLTKDDAHAMHTARLRRYSAHGACNIHPAGFTTAIAHATAAHAFGLGLLDQEKLVAHLWAVVKDDITLSVEWWVADSPRYWLELLKGVATLQDQVQHIIMPYPAGICLEDLLRSPYRRLRGMMKEEQSPYPPPEYWQIRILDTIGCFSKISLPMIQPYRFNARLHGEPPLASTKAPSAPSDYTISVGEHSTCEKGHTKGLPLLECGIGALSRLWCGAYSASTLALSDHCQFSDDSLRMALDRLFALPTPMCDWYF